MKVTRPAWVSVLALAGTLGFWSGCSTHAPERSEATAVAVAALGSCAAYDVTTQRGGNDRRGEYADCTLSPSNVGNLTRAFSLPVTGLVYAQPLLARNVATLRGTRDVLYVATTSNDLYAFDATGAIQQPIWHTNTGPAVDFRDYAVSGWTQSSGGWMIPIAAVPQAGILSTPVLATPAGTGRLEVFVLTELLDGQGQFHFELRAYDATTGALVASSGAFSNPSFNAYYQVQRPALTYVSINNRFYVAFGSHVDQQPYHGFVLSFDASNLSTVAPQFVCASCGGTGGGTSIWQAGVGFVADPSGNVYAMTGNGSGGPYDNAFVQLSGNPLSITSTFQSPGGSGSLDTKDWDLGSGGPILVQSQGQTLLAGGGKEGHLFLLDPANLDGGPTSPTCPTGTGVAAPIGCTAGGSSFGGIWGAPVYWTAQDKLFVWATSDSLRRFAVDPVHKTFTLDAIGGTPADGGPPESASMPGAAMAISENPQSGAAVLWAHQRSSTTAFLGMSPGKLSALDPNTLNILWDSDRAGAPLPGYGKFIPPMIANGRVYQGTATADNRLSTAQSGTGACTMSPTHPFTAPAATPPACGSLTGSIEVYSTSPPPARHVKKDFNGDGLADYLWHDEVTGEVAIWLSNGRSVSEHRHVQPGASPPGVDWIPEFTGDFNGDGNADILWQRTNGDVAIWLMQGATILSSPIIANTCGDWSMIGVGDFNNDGQSDILWYNWNPSTTCGTYNTFAVWLMNGTSIANEIAPAFGGRTPPTDFAGWARVADFDGDGTDDVLVWSTPPTPGNPPYESSADVWFVDPTRITSAPAIVNLRSAMCDDWQLTDAADVDHDGTADVIWRSDGRTGCAPSGEVAVWLMDGGRRGIHVDLPEVRLGAGGAPPPLSWLLASVADVDGDGHADFIWQDNTTGNITPWFVTNRQDPCTNCAAMQIWSGVPVSEWLMVRD